MQNMTPQMMEGELAEAGHHWGLLTGVGILLIVCGFAAMATPVIASGAAILLLGFLMAVGGIAAVIAGIRQRKSGGLAFYLITGILALLAGIIILKDPLVSLAVLTLLIAVWLFVAGIFRIVQAFMQKDGRGWLLFGGFLSMILGTMLWSGFPTTALWFLGLAVGIEMVFMGFSWLAVGFAAKQALEASEGAAAA